ncbi:MAG: hypothetical protein V3R94_03740, partial [Acidobacteriota bacterium]
MSKTTPSNQSPRYSRVWPIVPVLVLTGTWLVSTILPTESPEDLVPVRRSWTVMGTVLEATVYRPAT